MLFAESKPARLQLKKRDCPACGSPPARGVAAISSRRPAETCSFDELRDHWYGFFKEKIFFTYYRCGNCGILYAPEYFSAGQLSELYASMPKNMSDVSDRILERTQYSYFQHLRRLSALEGAYLEVGPDTGLLTQYCAREGNYTKLWLFEPNADAHPQLEARIGNIESHISTALLDLSAVPDGSIDVVSMIQVFDHISDPLPFMRALRPKLGPSAVVLLVTHDESSLLAKVTRARWPAYCLQHPQLFSPASMRALMARAGFQIETTPSANYFPVTYLLKHLAFVAGWRNLNLPALERLTLPLKLGNFVTVARPASD